MGPFFASDLESSSPTVTYPASVDASPGDGYQAFAIRPGRNWRQEHLELPLMIRALGLRQAERILEIGCGPFDLVVDFGTCFHIERSVDALREIVRVLAPGGLFATETPLSQLLSHPVRSFGRRLPWRAVAALKPGRHAGLWSLHRVVK
jgi:SAM-dependent methyltransferase